MKKLLLLASVMAMGVGINAQNLISENFDSYTANDYVATQADDFTTWTNSPGTAEDAFVIDSVAAVSGSNCFIVTGPDGGGSTDLILDMGAWEKGTFQVTLKFMVAQGMGGYFNLQKESTPGVQWGGDVFFSDDSTGYLSLGGTDYPFAYNTGEWTKINYIISLDADTAVLHINNELVHGWQWSIDGTTGNAGLNTLGGIDFFAYSPAGLACEYYVDDVTFSRIEAKSVLAASMENGMPGAPAALSLGAPWTTWSDLPGTGEDAVISNMMADGLNSIYLSEASTDLVYHFGNLTEGRYELSFDIYVDAGMGAYYNLMHEFDNATYQWALETVFNGDGTAVQSGGNTDYAFDYMEDAWNTIKYVIDMDNDNVKFYVNGMKYGDWQWSLNDANGAAGLNQLAVMDLFPAGSTNPSYYIDNLYMQQLVGMMADDIEVEDCAAFYSGQYVALGNPAWSTWSDLPGTSEDTYVTDMMSFSGENSMELFGGVGTDLVYPFGNLTSGAVEVGMKMYVPADGNGYLNLMHEFDNVGNVYQWALETYFLNDGTGTISAGGADAASFTYDLDTWIDVMFYVDMTNDYAAYYVAGEMVHEWQWSLTSQGAAGTNQLAVMDIYPPDAASHFYVDDFYAKNAETGLTVAENFDTQLSIYPNPANDVVYIMNDINEEVNLHVYNAAGQEVMNVQRVVNSGLIEVNTSDLNEGIYLIQLENANQVITKRIVVQH